VKELRPDPFSRAYTYDQIGNIHTKTGVGSYVYDPSHPHAVQTAGSASCTYDTCGNLKTGGGGLTVSWTSFNQPLQITRNGHFSQFSYGADEERVLQQTDRGNCEVIAVYIP
jgi:hypothetical protein